jgi:hypothetical protein
MIHPRTHAWLIKELGSFNDGSISTDIGTLAQRAAVFPVSYGRQTTAWEEELRELGRLAQTLMAKRPDSGRWPVLLEYEIPRRQKRPDVILIAHNVIFVIEFKTGAITFDAPDRWQVESYSLDLRDFHAGSAGKPIVPVLVATRAAAETSRIEPAYPNPMTVWHVQLVAPVRLSELILLAFEKSHQPEAPCIQALDWDGAPYRPSLTIIEAAQRLFSQHSVQDIKHAHSANLDQTTESIVAAIQRARQQRLRLLCFVTGIPGAGKTLTGLNAVHSPELRKESRGCGVFLSGNGPLIKIITSALVRDLKGRNPQISKPEIQREIESFIWNVHKFIDHYERGNKGEPPNENVVVFDEAQRAWSGEKMKSKDRGPLSEPDLMLKIMGRLDWCTIVALVGGGQEIHDGEAGLEEWGRAIARSESRWSVHAPPEVLEGGVGVAGHRLFPSGVPSGCAIAVDQTLHLAVSVRSYRAEIIADWVNRLLADDIGGASDLLRGAGGFPLVLSRDLATVRRWLQARAGREFSDGRITFDRRCGLVASSENVRLRAYGLEVSTGFRMGYPYEKWFLEDPSSVLSSNQLEVAATEFECQGLELDWVGVCWGDDLVPGGNGGLWSPRRFYRGEWRDVKDASRRQYMINKYRVLLTRAREGMAIWVPPGDKDDRTRPLGSMEATADRLKKAGVVEISL